MTDSYTVEHSFNWFNNATVIVKMYFLNNIPFTFDDLPDGHLYDKQLVEEANKNKDFDIEDVYIGSNYLMLEQCHPCFDILDIKNRDELPDDLIPYFDEEDLLG